MEEMYTVKEQFTLPSKGKIYEKPIRSEIELRSWNTREEMVRQSASVERPYKALADLVEGCIVGEKPEVHVYDMHLGDYEFLLHKARVVTYGPEYKMIVQCPKCNKVEERIFNLEELEVVDFNVEEFEELRTLELKRSKKTVHLNYETPHMLDDIEVEIKNWKKRNKDLTFDPRELIRLKHYIDTVDDVKLTDEQLETFINKLPAKDSNDILNRVEKITGRIGLDTTFQYTCSKCGFDTTTFFRYGPEFLRPTED